MSSIWRSTFVEIASLVKLCAYKSAFVILQVRNDNLDMIRMAVYEIGQSFLIFRYNICLQELVLYQYYLTEFIKIYTRMPKKAQSSLSKVRAYEVRYPTEFMATARGKLFCTLCSTIVSHDRKFSVDKNRQSTKHHKALSSISQ